MEGLLSTGAPRLVLYILIFFGVVEISNIIITYIFCLYTQSGKEITEIYLKVCKGLGLNLFTV